jgi:secondary thiamine-phosphate synthase enzyme
MEQIQTTLRLRAPRRGLYEITDEVAEAVRVAGIRIGMCHLLLRHTSASLLLQENADPTARRDLEAYFDRLAPEGDPRYVHTIEGPEDIPAHLKAALTAVTLAIPVRDGRLTLGTWQGIYLFEHRSDRPAREIVVHLAGE